MPVSEPAAYLGRTITVQVGCGFFTGKCIEVGPKFHGDIPLCLRGKYEGQLSEPSDLVCFLDANNASIEKEGASV